MLEIQAVVVFIFTFSPVKAKDFSDKNPIPTDPNCNPMTKLLVDINFHFFEDQHAMTVIDTSDLSIGNVFKCLNGNQFRPMDIFPNSSLVHIRRKTEKSSVSYSSVTHGFLIKILVHEIKETLRIIAVQNPRSKVMVLLNKDEEKHARKILHDAFHDFKMLMTAVAITSYESRERKNANTTIKIIMFNPYYGNKKIRDPQFVNFEVTTENSNQLFADIKNFMKIRLKNLHEFPFRVNIFEYPMISKAERDESGKISHYSFVDGDTLSTIAKCMNFTPLYDRLFEDEATYGFQYPNGTFTGSLADIEYDRVELVANPRLISDAYNTTKSAFLQPIATFRLSFIIQKRKAYKLMMISIFGQYDEASKIISISLSVLFPLIYVLISRCEQRIMNLQTRFESIDKSILYSFALQNNVSMKHSPLTSTRIVVTMILFYSLIISTLFQSTIVKNLNTKQRLGKINTIKELVSDGYKIKMPGHLALIFKEPGLDKVSRMMKATKQNYVDVATSKFDLRDVFKSEKKIAYLWTDLYNTNYLNRFYDRRTGENLYESVPEVAFEFYISLMAPKNSPFIEKYNEILQSYIESGIGGHHVGFAYYDNDKIWTKRIKNGETPKPSDGAIKFEDLRLAFEIHVYLCTICCVVFIVEILVNHTKRIKITIR